MVNPKTKWVRNPKFVALALLCIALCAALVWLPRFKTKRQIKRNQAAIEKVNPLSQKRKRCRFSCNWFDYHIPMWNKMRCNFANRPVRILEIGVFEGASTTWILENYATNKDSKIYALDTFAGSAEHLEPMEKDRFDLKTLEERFCYNMDIMGEREKIEILKGDSARTLSELRVKKAPTFDLVYVDGSHIAGDVLADSVGAWPLVKIGGYLVFDD